MFVRMLQLPQDTRDRYDVSSLRVAIHAAAPCPVEVKQKMIDWWGPVLFEYYAGTEGNGMTAIDSATWLTKPGTVGRPIMGTVRICADDGTELPAGQTGGVYFESEEIPFAYHNDPDKTRAAQHPAHPNWTTLGDIGYLDDDGFLFLTDRRAFTIISGGVNIYPQETENVLALHPAVYDVAVIGLPDPEMGESVAAFVQPAPGAVPGTRTRAGDHRVREVEDRRLQGAQDRPLRRQPAAQRGGQADEDGAQGQVRRRPECTAEISDAAALDLARYIRPGDLVAWGQGCAEPLTLTEALAAQRKRLGGVRCFTGISSSAAVRPEHCDYLSFSSYTAAGANRALSEAGLLDILPCHYSELPDILGRGPLRADVLFLSLPPPGPDGTFGLGLAADYLATLIGRAGTVIAEVNDQVPEVGCDRRLSRGEIDVIVRTSRPPASTRRHRPAMSAERSPTTSRASCRTARPSRSASAACPPSCCATCAATVTSACTPG